MEGIRLIHDVGSAQMCRKKSTEEGRMQGSHEGNMKGGRAKLSPSISRHFSPHHAVTTYPTSPDLATIVWPHHALTTCLSLPGAALASLASPLKEPVGLAVLRAIENGQCGKARTGLAFLFEPGHRCTERSTQS